MKALFRKKYIWIWISTIKAMVHKSFYFGQIPFEKANENNGTEKYIAHKILHAISAGSVIPTLELSPWERTLLQPILEIH